MVKLGLPYYAREWFSSNERSKDLRKHLIGRDDRRRMKTLIREAKREAV